MASNYTRLGAAELAALIASGEASSVAVVEAHIARLRQVHGTLNAMVAPRFDAARMEAHAADARQRSGAPLGPLHGVPCTIKDCLDLEGSPSTYGLESRAGHRALQDQTHVALLRAAGAIPLAKSNVAQLLLYFEADNPVYGRTRNPWNAERTCGGSSGGEGALVAVQASPLGLGNDIGGSVRVPAAFCGVTALKPTSGRCDDMSRFMPLGQRAVPCQVGVLARSVEDVALGTGIISSAAEAQLPAVPALGDWRGVDPARLRIGWYTDDGSFAVAPAVARAVREAADMLRAAGATLVPWTPPDARAALNLFYGILGADAMQVMRKRLGRGRLEPQIRQLLALARLPRSGVRLLMGLLGAVGQHGLAANLQAFGYCSAAHYWELVEAQLDYQQRFAAALDGASGGPIDLIVCPACALPAFTHGASAQLLTAGAYSCLYNLLGYPAGVVPVTTVGESEQVGREPSGDLIQKTARKVEQGSIGLPIAVQVVARPWREHQALAAMQLLQQAARSRVGYPVLPAF